MKNLKKVLALVLAVVMIMSVVTVASAKTYTDVKGTDTYADAIDALSSLKILDGFKDGDNYSFKAEDPFTRAQAAKIVAIVHNAATNGEIKDQDAISGLYSNAQNPFVDCNNSWALPFINYCRITGLADGMTATTYEPNRYVTGVQFLKLMLTTLNFDTAKEGYTGTGWDVNVLNRANEVGLTDGLKDGWKAIDPITRGEAAQVLFNALQAYLVEYGQKVKHNITSDNYKTNKNIGLSNWYETYGYSFVSNEQVSASGYTLGGKMGIKITAAHDVFMRPGYVWSYGSWSAFYLNSAKASYETATSLCDILVDLGIKKTAKDSINYVVYRNGVMKSSKIETVSHVGNACDVDLAGTGALTQVYKVTYADTATTTKTVYVISIIDTFLAKVDKVNTTKHGKVLGNSTEFTVSASDVNTTPWFGARYTNGSWKVTADGLTDYAKNDYVLTHIAINSERTGYALPVYADLYDADTKIYNNTTKAAYDAIITGFAGNGAYIVDVEKAGTIEAGKFTGRSLPDYDVLTVNDTKTPANVTYTLTTGAITANPLAAKTLDFFLDQYKNLIGDKSVSTTKSYGVVDGIVWITNGASYADSQFASAGLVKAGEDAVTTVDVASVTTVAGGKQALKGVTENGNQGAGDPNAGTVSPLKANNAAYVDGARKYGVVSYSVDSDGVYSFTYAGTVLTTIKEITATNPNIGAYWGENYFADDDTIFVVRTKNADGSYSYKSYTGISNVPTIKQAAHVVAVKEKTDSFCKFVYVDAENAIFAGSTAIAYVATSNAADYEDTTTRYSYVTAYVNGELTTIEVDEVLKGQVADKMFNAGTGLYELSFNSNGKLIKATALMTDKANVTADGVTAGYKADAIDYSNGNVFALKSGKAVNVTGAKVYVINYHVDYNELIGGTSVVTYDNAAVGEVKDLADDATVVYTYATDSTYMVDTIYVYVEG